MSRRRCRPRSFRIAQDFTSPLTQLIGRRARLLLAIYWPLLFLATHMPRVEIDKRGLDGIPPDKLIHFGIFALLTVLIVLARPAGRSATAARNVLVGVAVAAVYALVDELTQTFVGRVIDPWDLVANYLAVAAVGVAMLADADGGRDVAERTTPWLARGLLAVATVVLLIGANIPGLAVNETPVLFLRDFGVHLRWNMDKVAHFVVPMGLLWLAIAARLAGRRRRQFSALLAVALVVAIAPIIEYAQTLTGRQFSVDDVLAHLLGTALGLIGWVGVSIVRRLNRRPADDHTITDRFVGHAMLVSALTLLSRVTGLVRDAVLGAAFGLSPVLGAFTIGFLVPNLFRRLFGEGALTAAFIPRYTELLKQDRRLAKRLATLCIALLLVVTASLVLLGELLLAALQGARDWSGESTLAIRLTMLMLPYMPMICLVALIGGILQVHGRFGPPAAAPIILNLTMILAVLFATAGVDGQQFGEQVIHIVAVSVLLAGLMQLLYQVIAMLRVESFTLRLGGAWRAMRPVLAMMLPMLFGLAVFQINAFADTLIAYAFAPPEARLHDTFTLLGREWSYPIADRGAAAALAFAQRLYQFPLGVFGIALATAIFPALSRTAAQRDGDADAFRNTFQHGLRLAMFIGLPASVGLVFVRLPLARLIFQYGDFDLPACQRVATILAGYACGVWAYSVTHVITRAFYANQDAMTPLKVSLVMVAFNLTLNLTLIWPLSTAGLAWSTAISAAIQVVILLMVIRRHIDAPVNRDVLLGWGKTLLLTVVMGACLVPFVLQVNTGEMGRAMSAMRLGAMVLVGAAVFTAGAWLLKCDELRWLIRRRVG